MGEDYAREIKSDALFITRLGTIPTGESIRKIIKSKLRQLGIDEMQQEAEKKLKK